MLNLKNKKNDGFTLIELLVAMAIFVIFVAVIADIFFNGLMGQKRTLAFEQVFEQNSYLMEYMSRSLRMARKELSCTNPLDPATCSCLKINGYGFNYEKTRSDQGIRFINSRNECQEFYWETATNRLKENKGGAEQYLTAADAKILFFNVNLAGQNQTDPFQPKATIFLSLEGVGGKPESRPKIQIQTTVSQRKLDVQL